MACQLLVTSVDFKSSIPLNPEKIRFVRERMHQLDYKNMRDLLKLLLVEKLDKMQCVLSEYQHQQLMPVEEVRDFPSCHLSLSFQVKIYVSNTFL